jgi:hypothetical protein
VSVLRIILSAGVRISRTVPLPENPDSLQSQLPLLHGSWQATVPASHLIRWLRNDSLRTASAIGHKGHLDASSIEPRGG